MESREVKPAPPVTVLQSNLEYQEVLSVVTMLIRANFGPCIRATPIGKGSRLLGDLCTTREVHFIDATSTSSGASVRAQKGKDILFVRFWPSQQWDSRTSTQKCHLGSTSGILTTGSNRDLGEDSHAQELKPGSADTACLLTEFSVLLRNLR